jgi:diguanylate cyclase (GGDEF)-like protein
VLAEADEHHVTTTPLRSASLAARLLALVVVPLVAFTVLGVQRIDAERRTAQRTEQLADVVRLQGAVAAVYPYANLERTALEGLTRIDELGVPRILVVTIAGVDLEEITSTNAALLDAALDDLDGQYGDLVLPDDGTTLGARLDAFRRELGTQRARVDAGAARRVDVEMAFEQLLETLELTLTTAQVPDGLPTGIAGDAMAMRALTDVLLSAGDYGRQMLRALVLADETPRTEASQAYAAHVALVDVFERTLATGDQARFHPIGDGVRDFVAEVPDSTSTGATGATDPTVIRAATTAFLDLFDYLGELAAYASEFRADVSARAQQTAEDAGNRAEQTAVLLLATAIATAVLVAGVMVSILGPLRRLRARATAISNGELALDPLPPRGPSDVRALTTTMNEMLGTLHRVHAEITLLAAGDVDPDHAPDLPGAIGVSMRDSVRHLASVTAQLQRSEELSSAVIAQAADAIWTVTEDGTILTANEASGRLTRIPPAEQLDRRIDELLSAHEGEATLLVGTEPRPTVLVATSTIDVGDERIIAVIAHDISERRSFEERLTYQANHDALTGLPNRFAVLAHLEELLRTGESVAVLFVDLDSFKSVNDTRGHAVGDRVLATVAGALRATVRNDEFVGRLGGDEFVVVMRDVHHATEAIALGYRIIREVEQPQEHDGSVFVLSASVGVAFPEHGTTALDAIRQADNAVYQAKKRGRGRVERFDADMQEQIEHEADLELALRQAVRDDELVLHLQPVFDLAGDRIVGAEALVRWARPGHGLVPPGEFITVAERSSLIFEVERWVLTQACARVAEWRRIDPTCSHRIAVNISGRHLIEGDLLSDVEAALAMTGADPHMLELELTETQLLEDLARATTVLEGLRARGITIAVDDFGTGYSSMTYLRHLPIDVVKIDRSFVANATEHGYDSTVIEALLTIARTLQLTVIAEGIETEEQLEYLRRRGCHRAQGYLLARPMPIADAEALMCGERCDVTSEAGATARAGVSPRAAG